MKTRRVTVGPPPYKLNLGCKDHIRSGWVNLDFVDFGQEILWDLTEGIPLPDNSVTKILARHVLEHIADANQRDLWEEMRRVCQDRAVIYVVCPHAESIGAWCVCHASYWTTRRMEGIAWGYTEKKLRCLQAYDENNAVHGNFEVRK